MKKYIGLALLFIVVYVVSLVATTPLAVVLNWVNLPRGISLEQPSGTIWQGRVATLSTPQLQLNQLSWDFHVSALFLGRVQAEVEFASGKQLLGSGLAGLSFSGWYLKDWQVDAPASWLTKQYPLPVPAVVEGDVQLQLQQLNQGEPWCQQLQGQLNWFAPVLQTPLGVLRLDDVKGQLSCQDGEPTFELKHSDQQVALELLASVNQSRWSAEGKIKAAADMPKTISDNLKYIGRPDPQGFYRFKQQGRLAL
ncbi:type II secretion system protein N [Agarivorans sp.]|uniref:type II secretion system protein N n=1 Tax=Agarivorans sp. TaxID=1872412 RepID=UPI003D0314BB